MKRYSVGRPINGISLNPLEYVLNDNDKVQAFTSDELCGLLKTASIKDAEEQGFIIEEII